VTTINSDGISRYRKVDAETGDEVESDKIIKGYEVAKGEYIETDPKELEAVAIESRHTIEIDEFVPKQKIDELSTCEIPTTSFLTAMLANRHPR
jgi:non-homologous end joining protein Ku